MYTLYLHITPAWKDLNVDKPSYPFTVRLYPTIQHYWKTYVVIMLIGLALNFKAQIITVSLILLSCLVNSLFESPRELFHIFSTPLKHLKLTHS